MFPIRDRRGRTIAFGGRTLGSDQPKYLNSPESPLFRKGEGLYGVAEARDAIRAADRAVLVEGYMDALILVQEGIPYTVATLGTALTAAQLRLLRPLGGDRLAVCFFFDGDRAGRQAALRAFAVCAEAGVWGRAAFLPEGFDPDSYTRQHGGAATVALLDAAPMLGDLYFDTLVPAGATLPQRTRVADDLKRILARVTDDVHFELLARQAAARLGISEAVFRRSAAAAAPARPAPTASPPPAAAWPPRELQLIQGMAIDRQVAQAIRERGTLQRFRAAELVRAGEAIVAAWEAGRAPSQILDQLEPAVAEALMPTMMGDGPVAHWEDRLGSARGIAELIESAAAKAARQPKLSTLREAERAGAADVRAKEADLRDELRRKEGGAG
jgi:DNA primase